MREGRVTKMKRGREWEEREGLYLQYRAGRSTVPAPASSCREAVLPSREERETSRGREKRLREGLREGDAGRL
jgi:hypothetical protein